MITTQELAGLIRATMNAAGLTVREAADLAQMGTGALSDFLNHRRKLSVMEFARLCELLELDPTAVLRIGEE